MATRIQRRATEVPSWWDDPEAYASTLPRIGYSNAGFQTAPLLKAGGRRPHSQASRAVCHRLSVPCLIAESFGFPLSRSSVLRITELKLPLDHAPDALRPAVLARLGLQEDALRDMTVVRRAWDARRKSAILLIYTLDCHCVMTHSKLTCCAALPMMCMCDRHLTCATFWSAARRRILPRRSRCVRS